MGRNCRQQRSYAYAFVLYNFALLGSRVYKPLSYSLVLPSNSFFISHLEKGFFSWYCYQGFIYYVKKIQ